LWEANRRLSWRLAGLVTRRHGYLKYLVDGDDVRQAADVGLMHACGIWNPARATLGTLAWFCVRRSLQDEVRRGRSAVAPPSVAASGEVAWRLPLSLDREVAGRFDRGRPYTYGAVIPARPAASPGHDELKFEEMLAGLPQRLADALRLRLVDGKTLREVGEVMGVTKERVRQLCAVAVKRLRRRMGVTA
jgi:RNA polymerase sigma factor (sigma-70 family)